MHPIVQEVVKQAKLAGFLETVYDGQDATFYTKKYTAAHFVAFGKNLIDYYSVFPESEVIICICPDGMVQYVTDDYYEQHKLLVVEEFDRAIELLEFAGVLKPLEYGK